jgi:hypothetical protein
MQIPKRLNVRDQMICNRNRHASGSLGRSRAAFAAALFRFLLFAEVMSKTGDANQDSGRGNKTL